MNSLPMPGMLKICSVMTRPPNSAPMSSAITVTSGISALRSPCLSTTRCDGHALGAGGADVVGRQRVEHRRALVPAPRGDDLHRQRQHRQHKVARVVAEAATSRRCAG